MTDPSPPPCPTCPVCGASPWLVLGGGTQAFCGDENCQVLTWDPTMPDGGLSNAKWIDLDSTPETGV